MKHTLCLLVLSLFCLAVRAQISVPAAAMPTKSNQRLIDSLLQVTKWENYFVTYCEQHIDAKAKEEKWSYQQVADVKKQINYKNFKESTLYNFYSFFTSAQLVKLIAITKEYNAEADDSFIFITNPIIQQNMELDLSSYYNAVQ